MTATTTLMSENSKLYGKPGSPHWKGHPIAATARKVGVSSEGTCPSNCPYLPKADGGNGACYASTGNMRFVSARSTRDDGDGAKVAGFVRGLPRAFWVRHHTAGDIGKNDAVDHEYLSALLAAHDERPDLVAWTYTHFHKQLDAAETNAHNVVFNASTDSTAEAVEAVRAGWPTVTVVASDDTRRSWTEDGVKFVTCPNMISSVACRYCGLCAKGDRGYVVAFRAHGSNKKKIDARLEGLTPLPMASD